jgi:hypothetical protein
MNTQSTNQSPTVYHQSVVKGVLKKSKYEYTLIKIRSVSFQPLKGGGYLIRGYEEGKNHPCPHTWTCVADIEGGFYNLFGYTKVGDKEIVPSQQRIMHKFFRDMGLEGDWIRGKKIDVKCESN